MLLYGIKIYILLFFVGVVYAVPADDVQDIVEEGEQTPNGDTYIKYIVPSGYFSQKGQKQFKVHEETNDFVDEEDEDFKLLEQHIRAGYTLKGLTFNIYDDSTREATIALFKLLQNAKDDKIFRLIKNWAFKNINRNMADYAYRLASLYRNDFTKQEPPFITKPNFFVNSETINKAFKLKVNNGKFDEQEALVNHFYKVGNVVTIRTNYSGWNIRNKDCEYLLDYFREDIGLNSYYYGVHLLYPFWMSNDDLTEIDPRYAQKHYYIHQQLNARYKLENEHLKVLKHFNNSGLENCFDDFNPYLMYENGLSFPTRSSTIGEWNDEQARIKTIDIAIKECISRGFIYMDNGTKVELTEDNYVDLLAKLVRANYEGPKTAKIVKSLYGYGGSGYPVNRYNPAPSVQHHPETTLRDPIYWYLIESLLKYFNEFATTLKPYDFSKYQTDEFKIVDYSLTKLTTYYDYFEFNLNKVFGDFDDDVTASSLLVNARQKRLQHLPFNFNFSINSNVNRTATVKMFLGPQCYDIGCWQEYTRFYELDSFAFEFEEGINHVFWSPESTNKFSYDGYFNFDSRSSKKNKFDLFKFPENMLLPKGLEQGLNLTLFVLVAPLPDISDVDDLEPIGFPFHRPVLIFNESNFQNYKFINITIFHKEGRKDTFGQFSSHLN